MRLSRFILDDIEPILQEWENFARSMAKQGEPLDTEALRDHAELMLRAISADLQTAQSAQQQTEKSQGHGPADEDSAAESHAMTRLMEGFTVNQLISEFRALRASVVSHWMSKIKAGAAFEIDDLVRFNEAIDQALAESITTYTGAIQTSRDIFLGILGHDLRTPLSAISLGADILLRTTEMGARATKTASSIQSSVKRVNQIVGDLLDFTRVQMGPGIPVKRTSTDLGAHCERIVDEMRTAHPEATIVYTHCGAAQGNFDGARLEQVFSNLLGNAVQHGARGAPITVTLDGADDGLMFRVHNSGRPIAAEALPFIFNPMGRYSSLSADDHGPNASLGLGLFIAAAIVAAHGGRIDVSSDERAGTQFSVQLPLGAASAVPTTR